MNRKTAYIVFAITGILFLFCFLTEGDLARDGNIVWTVPYTLKTVAVSLIGGAFGGIAVRKLAGRPAEVIQERRRKSVKVKPTSSAGECLRRLHEEFCKNLYEKLTPLPLFVCSLVLIMLAWLPCYLAFYPGICAYDFPIQTGQIESGNFIDHHPIAHTLLIKGAMRLGEMIAGDVNAGIGLFVFLQMLFLGGVFAWSLVFLKRHGLGMAGLTGLQVICMFFPFHWYMSISVAKDIVFTGFFLIQLLSLCELTMQAKYQKKSEVLFFIGTVGMIVFRTNGQYAFMVLVVLVAMAAVFGRERGRWGKLFLLSLVGLLSGMLLLNVIFRVTGAQQGDRREMLSMPIQQLARVMVYHGGVGVIAGDDNTLTESEKALISDFILNEAYRDYDPHIADPVKRNTNTYVARYRMKEFVLTYLNLFAKYPGDFLNAALETNAGYLYPGDVSHAYINASEQESGLGYVQIRWEEKELNSRGIYKDSKWESLYGRLARWADENAYLKIPVLKYLFMPGIWLWLYLLLFGYLCASGKGRLCLPLILILCYYATLFLGPTVQLRYIYPIMAAFPFLLSFYIRSSSLSSARPAGDRS